MASITSWSRLEPRARSTSMHTGLQARIHDPLWLMARQWQLGEFQGEDAGSPISARLRADVTQLTRYHAGPLNGTTANGQAYDGRQAPLETLVERERVGLPNDFPVNPGFAAEAGLYFLRLLEAHGVGHYRADYVDQYALQADQNASQDPDSRRFFRVMAGRAPDGALLYLDLNLALRPPTGEPALPEKPVIATVDAGNVTQAANAWLTWYETHFSEPARNASAWTPERMEYAFSVAAPTSDGEDVLVASEYHGGHLDWYHFNTHPQASLGAASDAAPQPITRTVMPSPVSYRGMPASRWWAFEDAEVDLGAIDTAPEDLGRMLLMEFAMVYGDDWFVMPVDLDVGSICQVQSLVVTNTFGERTLIRPYQEVDGEQRDWQLFSISPDRRVADAAEMPQPHLFLPPVLGPSLHSAPIEEILLLRDEMANMAWAVERRVENARGRSTSRHETYQAQRQQEAETTSASPADADLLYHLSTRVPDHWIPLVPVPETPDAIRLQRASMLPSNGDVAEALEPLGRILTPGQPLSLYEEEVPRTGAHVARAFQYARWIDGSTHVWMGRAKRPGRGEGWSGLRFDVVEDAAKSSAG